ncbi:MAG: hypothetical protein ACLU5I_11015 [Alistipes finegoldii]
MRLNRFLAQSGLCSCREPTFHHGGSVTNGQIVTQLGTKDCPPTR